MMITDQRPNKLTYRGKELAALWWVIINPFMAEARWGGPWTRAKLELLESYLQAYTTALKRQRFETWYIDAFAGTGMCELPDRSSTGDPSLLGGALEVEEQDFLKGSAMIATSLETPFDHYVFIEKDAKRAGELRNVALRTAPHLKSRIEIRVGDANEQLVGLCREVPWRDGPPQHRGVLFLDPYGLNVPLTTLAAVAETKALDVWYLFCTAAAQRMLRHDREEIPRGHRKRLDQLFGNDSWASSLYSEAPEGDAEQLSLFEQSERGSEHTKARQMRDLCCYLADRLATLFPYVHPEAVALRNTRKAIHYVLLFMAANPSDKAQTLVRRLANDMLKHMEGIDCGQR